MDPKQKLLIFVLNLPLCILIAILIVFCGLAIFGVIDNVSGFCKRQKEKRGHKR